MAASEPTVHDAQVDALRSILTREQEPLARRFRALFSLKYLASLQPPTEQTVPAIEAIAAAFTSPSALLKHELAYCLGQSRNDAAISPLRHVLQDKHEDPMCRHEAAEALGALGDRGSLDLLKGLRDDANELDVVRETCDIAVDRIEWEHGLQSKDEQLKKRYVRADCMPCVLRELNEIQRFCIHRPCPAAASRPEGTLHPRAGEEPARHITPAV
jgi:deoxyhypusine monooxygenase